MHIFSDKKSALLTITGCIVLLGVTLTVFNLLTNTATASHNNYEGTVMLDTQNQTGDSDTADDTGKIITADGQVWFRLMNVDESTDGGVNVMTKAKLDVESPDDPNSTYETGFFEVEDDVRTIDGEEIELISVEEKGSGSDWYWELEFGLIDDDGGGGGGGGNCRTESISPESGSNLASVTCTANSQGDVDTCGTGESVDNSGTFDASNAPNSDEYIEEIQVTARARVSCSVDTGGDCDTSSDAEATIGGQSVSESESLNLSPSGNNSDNDVKLSKSTLVYTGGATTISSDQYAEADADDGSDNDSTVTSKAKGDVLVDVKVCEQDNNPPTCDDDGTNDNPICVDSSDPTDINVLDNDSDPDGDDLEVTKVAGNSVNDGNMVSVGNGTVTVKDADAGILRYTPSNTSSESFTYTAADGNGGTDQATVYIDPGSCGPLTVRVEDPDGNLVPGVGFEPKYDEDNDGQLEQLPEKGLETGEFTYNVNVDNDPSLSKMNESLITQFPDGFATSVEDMNKDVEKTAGQAEPDDHWYPVVQKETRKSKLATDPDSTGGQCSWDNVTDEFDGTLGTNPTPGEAETEETATLNLQNVVASGRNLKEVKIGYRISAQACPDNQYCLAEATTTADIDGEIKTDHVVENIDQGGGSPTMVTDTFRYNDEGFLQDADTLDIVSEVLQQEDGSDAFVSYNTGGISIYTCP